MRMHNHSRRHVDQNLEGALLAMPIYKSNKDDMVMVVSIFHVSIDASIRDGAEGKASFFSVARARGRSLVVVPARR